MLDFTLHYYFKDQLSFKGYLSNLLDNCKHGGYFIGTCYDGEMVFNMLREKKKGDQIRIFKDDHKIWELTKQYNKDYFLPDNTSLGYGIDIYQESINQSLREYLVNFSFLEKIMILYGFKLVNDIEGMKGMDSFESLSNEEQFPLSNEEKIISFLNKYFIFQKISDVDIVNIEKLVFNATSKPKAVKIKRIRLVKKI